MLHVYANGAKKALSVVVRALSAFAVKLLLFPLNTDVYNCVQKPSPAGVRVVTTSRALARRWFSRSLKVICVRGFKTRSQPLWTVDKYDTRAAFGCVSV